MDKCVLLAARRYNFKDREQGNQVQGVTLTYLTGEVINEPDRRGVEPLTVSAAVDVFAGVREVPGVYEMDWRQRPGKNGRPSLQVVGLKYVSPVVGLTFDGSTG